MLELCRGRSLILHITIQSKGDAQGTALRHNRRTGSSTPGNHQGMEWHGEMGPSWASSCGESLSIHMDLPGTEPWRQLHLSEQPPLRQGLLGYLRRKICLLGIQVLFCAIAQTAPPWNHSLQLLCFVGIFQWVLWNGKHWTGGFQNCPGHAPRWVPCSLHCHHSLFSVKKPWVSYTGQPEVKLRSWECMSLGFNTTLRWQIRK